MKYKSHSKQYPHLKNKFVFNYLNKKYTLFIFKTKVYAKDDQYKKNITNDIIESFLTIRNDIGENNWFVVISEKIVAISQGRSFLIKNIRPRLSAQILHRFVSKNPYGIGLRSPYTMELAIREVGLSKVIFAAFCSAISKPFGIKGLFYKILGRKVASIDGPTKYSLYPSNISAKLGPLKPQNTSEALHSNIIARLEKPTSFIGVIILDANDLGRDILGNSTKLDNLIIENIFKSNPMGQTDEQTPLTIVTLNS